MLSTSLLLDVPGVFQPLEGLSWWSTVGLSPGQAQLLSLGVSTNQFPGSLRFMGFLGSGWCWSFYLQLKELPGNGKRGIGALSNGHDGGDAFPRR